MATAVQSIYTSHTAQQPTGLTEVKRVRTIVVDDSETFLQVACELLELNPLVNVIARAEKGGQAIETVLKLKPDLVLMDVHMPYLDGFTLAWFFTNRFPSARVVLMSSEDTPELRQACVESGALGFVHKENFRQDFRAALRRVCSGVEQS